MKSCAVKNCPNKISSKMLMCLDHWRKVPRMTQNKVYQVARKYQRANPQAGNFWEVHKEYYDTASEAVEAVISNVSQP